MKKISVALAVAGLGAATLMTACDSGTTNAKKLSKAEECASLTKECLVGTWAVNGFGVVENGAVTKFPGVFDYSGTPGALVFKEDGSFSYKPPVYSNTASDVDCSASYGTWSVEGATLTMKSSSMCAQGSVTITPTVIVGAIKVDMAFDRMWFLKNESDEQDVRARYVEVFSTSAQ
ncbi:MAG: lipocalin family protein [Fibrobacter sp.]|nr:lipocalin family protein [Fibrobacter sp.]